MARVKVYDAEDLAVSMVETFKNRPYEYKDDLPFTWPRSLQNVGDSLAVAYDSDKWKPKNARGRRDRELYKHLAESRNQVFVKRGFLKQQHNPRKSYPVRGPAIHFDDCPMPRHFAILARFTEANLLLYTGGTNGKPTFSDDGDEGVVKVTVRHGMLGGSKILWSREDSGEKDEAFIFVYTNDGVCMIITGDELDIEKDGIVG